MSGVPPHQRTDNHNQFMDEEYENVSQDEDFDLEMPNSQNQKEFEFSINSVASQRRRSDETPSTSIVSNPIEKTDISNSSQRRNPREETSAGVLNSNQNAVNESFIVLPPKERGSQESGSVSFFPKLEPTRVTSPQIVIKPEEQAPSQITDLPLSDFPDAQQPPDSYPTTEQENIANPVHNNSQVDQPPEASNESSQAQRENEAQESDNTGRRRYRSIRINIYYFHRRGRGVPERGGGGVSFLNHILTGLKILLIMAILYHIFSKEVISLPPFYWKEKLYILQRV